MSPHICSSLTLEVANINNLVSDHHLLFFTINCTVGPTAKRTITSRDYTGFDIVCFKSDVSDALRKLSAIDADTLQTTLQENIDRHAPKRTRLVKERTKSPWYNDDTKQAKRIRRKCERRWQKSGLLVDKTKYIKEKCNANNVNRRAKQQYFSSKFVNASCPKEFFRLCDELLGKEATSELPTSLDKANLPDQFGQFFKSKIDNIRQDLESHPLDLCSGEEYCGQKLFQFQEVTESDVSLCIMSAASKCCELDPISTQTLKTCLDVLLSPITAIMNDSLRLGVVPDVFKIAHVKPLLKKTDLDRENLKNYRPVSNLPFLSKILEKLVLKQLLLHLETNSLKEPFQSAYREHHSTETALVRVMNDLLNVIDQGSCSLLTLLDLSSAFDTIDHALLLNRLESIFGISGTALSWFSSYLANRRQTVVVENHVSEEFILDCGVPQGSVLGPVLFVLYVGPLSTVIRGFGLSYHQYADDTQLYGTESAKRVDDVLSNTERCVLGAGDWMSRNRLKLNGDKTEVMFVGNKKYKSESVLRVGETNIQIVESVKNLGVFFDSALSMELQINNLVKAMNFQLRKISSIRQYISEDVTKTLIVSLVLSRLDYCNALLSGVPQTKLKRLQVVQNNAARLIFRRRRRESAAPLLRELHWLPVERRIVFKTCVLVYRCLEKTAPSYLSNLLKFYSVPRSLRSSNDPTRLDVPRIRTRSGMRSFSHFGPSAWNAIPQSIRESTSLTVFRKRLKTFLF